MLTLMDRSMDYAEAVIAGIADEQRTLPTSCEGFSVERLTGHLVQGLHWFAGLPGGGSPDPTAVPEPALGGGSLVDAFRVAAGAVRAAWTPEQVGEMFDMPYGKVTGEGMLQFMIVEVLGHGWDLATATGQPSDAGDEVAEAALRVAQDLGEALREPGMMAPAVAVPADASPMDRFIAFLGRRPG